MWHCKDENCPEYGKPDNLSGSLVLIFMLVVGFLLLYWR